MCLLASDVVECAVGVVDLGEEALGRVEMIGDGRIQDRTCWLCCERAVSVDRVVGFWRLWRDEFEDRRLK